MAEVEEVVGGEVALEEARERDERELPSGGGRGMAWDWEGAGWEEEEGLGCGKEASAGSAHRIEV